MRYCGKIGYRDTVEGTFPDGTGNGIWKEQITEVQYKGDLVKDYSRNSDGESVNDDRLLANNISIVANKNVLDNFEKIIWCEWRGAKYKVKSIDATNFPRLTLSLGGKYVAGS